MPTATPSWRIIPYTGDSPYKKVRVWEGTRVQAVLRHLQAHECVALLGPPLSEKSHLLRDVAGELQASGLFRPLMVNLWQAHSTDEGAFFASLARLINQALDDGPPAPAAVPNPRSFQNYLEACIDGAGGHLVLLVDHLQALPDDLVHSLLLALRSTYMEHNLGPGPQFVAVVTGGMNLVGLSAGPTSPFNIARPVVTAPLSDEQSLALAEHTFRHLDYRVTAGALDGIVDWVGGDRYLIPRLCGWSTQAVTHHRRQLVTRTVINRLVERRILGGKSQAPVREAIRMLEEDPDSMLDVLHILDHGSLPRARSRQMITRTGTDRLQLSGAVVLQDGHYAMKNRAFREALARHFVSDRVGHVLRISGRWQEAIDYLAPRLQPTDPAPSPLPATAEPSTTSAPPAPTATSAPQRVATLEQARPQLLEAIVQSIYATDTPAQAFRLLAQGLRLGFGLAEVGIYRANLAQGRLDLGYALDGEARHRASIDLRDRASVEAQAFRYGNYALRGSVTESRLVVALVSRGRPFGLLTVERYVRGRDPHELPEDLPDLLRFLHHASGAIENVLVRAAFRRIGQAVLSASAVQPALAEVLETVAEALAIDFATLYLLDPSQAWLEMAAGIGGPWAEEGHQAPRWPSTSQHPAMSCLRELRFLVVRGSDPRLATGMMDLSGLRDHLLVYLPLEAAGQRLGTLELGLGAGPKSGLDEEQRRVIEAFTDQVAIAVYNMQLLRRTDQALARRVDELEKLRSSSLAVSSLLDADAVLARILQDLQALFPGTEATIWEYHADERSFTVLQSSLEDPTYWQQRLGMDSLSGRAVVTRQPQASMDLGALSGAPIQDFAARLGLRGLIVVPLVSQDRVLGTINLYTYAAGERPIGQGEEELLEAFAAQAAVAIDNARLHQEEVKRQRLEEELTVARQIQRSMLPEACPVVAGWQFAAVYQAARLVGGDFYDFYELPGKPPRLGLTIADVADKGVPAALFMALSRTVIRSAALSGRGPASALLRANQLILKDSQSSMFLSAVYAAMELETGRMIYANGGHNRPLWYHAATGEITELEGRGIILGIFEEIRLEERRVDLAPGDVLVFYTDGITEAWSEEGEMYEVGRLRAVIAAHGQGSAQEILDAILEDVATFQGAAEPADDVTCVVVRRGSRN